MGNLILFAILVVFSSNLFNFTYCGGGISDLFYSFNSVYLKSAVSTRNTNTKLADLGENVAPYFMEAWAERIVTDYFSKNISPFLKGPKADYNLTFDFSSYSHYLAQKTEVIAYPKEFIFRLEARFGGVYNFSNKKVFQIVKGNIHG